MKKFVRILLLLLTFSVPVSISIGAGKAVAEIGAKSFTAQEKRLEEVEKKLERAKAKVKKFERKESTVLGEIHRINRKLAARRRELKRSERDIARLKKKITRAGIRINRIDKERGSLKRLLAKRLVAIYKMRSGGALNLLLTVDNVEPAGLSRRHKYLSVIMEYDRDLLYKYDTSLKSLRVETGKLKGLRKEKEKSRRIKLAKKNEALALKRSKSRLLGRVKRQKGRSMKIAKELEGAAKELQGLLEELRSKRGGYSASGFSHKRGTLPRPVKGRVVAVFGKVRHPRFRTVTFNNGIVIDAPAGMAVKSVYAGKVVFTGWLKGYGQLMILDNGGGFYTLYAYLDKILKRRGEVVAGGDEIGLVGDTGPRESPGLYFELRERGVPRDPLRWLSKR